MNNKVVERLQSRALDVDVNGLKERGFGVVRSRGGELQGYVMRDETETVFVHGSIPTPPKHFNVHGFVRLPSGSSRNLRPVTQIVLAKMASEKHLRAACHAVWGPYAVLLGMEELHPSVAAS